MRTGYQTCICILLLISAALCMPGSAQDGGDAFDGTYRIGADILAISVSESGDFIAVGSRDDHVYLLDRDCTLMWQYRTGGDVNALAVSAEGSYVAAGVEDDYVYVLNKNGRLLWRSKLGGDVISVTFSADAKSLAAASAANELAYFDTLTGEGWNEAMDAEISSLYISDDGSFVLAGSNNAISSFTADGDLVWSSGILQPVRSIAASADGSLIAAGGDDGFLRTFDQQGNLLWQYYVDGKILDVAVTPGGDGIIGVTGNSLFCYGENGNLLWEIAPSAPITGMVLVAGGDRLIVTGSDDVLHIFTVDGLPIEEFASPRSIRTAAFSDSGSFVAIGSYDTNLYYRDISIQILEAPLTATPDVSEPESIPMNTFVYAAAGLVIVAGAALLMMRVSVPAKKSKYRPVSEPRKPPEESKKSVGQTTEKAAKGEDSVSESPKYEKTAPSAVSSGTKKSAQAASPPAETAAPTVSSGTERSAENLPPAPEAPKPEPGPAAQERAGGLNGHASGEDLVDEITEYWYDQGLKFSENGEYRSAVDAYDRALELDPDNADLWYNRGYALDCLAQFDEALASYGKALALNPDDTDAWNNRGAAFMELKRYNEALESFEKSIALNPRIASSWDNMATAYMGLEKTDEALTCIEKALELDPANERYRAHRYLITH